MYRIVCGLVCLLLTTFPVSADGGGQAVLAFNTGGGEELMRIRALRAAGDGAPPPPLTYMAKYFWRDDHAGGAPRGAHRPGRLAFHFSRPLAAGCNGVAEQTGQAIERLSPDPVEKLTDRFVAWQPEMAPHDLKLPVGPCSPH